MFTSVVYAPLRARAKARPSRFGASVSTAVLLLVGVLRVVAVKSTGYQEHVSEYGVHGNFFFILAAIRVSTVNV
jgi:hypothetical protein